MSSAESFMKTSIFLIIGLLVCCLPAIAAETGPIGGDQGYYVVHANVDGAAVYFDNDYKGVTSGGELTVPVYVTGTPYKEFSVSKEGYTTYTGDITAVPQKGESLDLYATLQVATPTQGPIGGDQAWYTVNCNVDGAAVYFGTDYKGDITGGVLSVPVYTTGTPYTQYSVQKAGYTTFTAPITQYPAQGETINLYATLNLAPTPTPTKGPVSIFTVLGGCAIIGALMIIRSSKKL
jgi:hypothetical protein